MAYGYSFSVDTIVDMACLESDMFCGLYINSFAMILGWFL